MKLRTRIFLCFTILTIIPMLFISIFSYKRYTEVTYERTDEAISQLYNAALTQVEEQISALKTTMGFLTFYSDSDTSVISVLEEYSDPAVEHSPYDVMQSYQYIKSLCQNYMFSNEDFYGIYLFTNSGEIFYNYNNASGQINQDYDFMKAKWYQDTLQKDGALYISTVGPHTDMFHTDLPSVFFAQSIQDVYTHKFLGVMVINCNPEMFDLSALNTWPDMTILTLSNTDNNDVLYSNINDTALDYRKNTSEIRKQSLSPIPLDLTAIYDYNALAQQLNNSAMVLITMGITCIVAYIVLAFMLTKHLVYPIEHLSRKIAKQNDNDLVFNSHFMERSDEIGMLYNEYSVMINSLQQSIKKDYQDKLIILDAQMKSLEARINSHFLFNTLESINSMAELADNEDIATMSLALGNMFRYSIKTQSELVSIQDELNHVRDYIAIQSIRFNNRFQLDIDIPEELLSEKVLKLILQPLVENALYHGLDYCRKGDRIIIHGYTKDRYLYLSVEDFGQGMDPDTLNKIQEKLREPSSFTELGHRNKQSIGLKNIHSRIELYYGSGYGLTVTSVLEKGTTVTIQLPRLKGDTKNVSISNH